MIEKLQIIQQRFDEVSDLIIQPDIISDQKRYVQLNKEYKDLSKLMEKGKVSKTLLSNQEEALEITNDTLYGLCADVWTRNGNIAYRMERGSQAGRVWTNCYHAYPAHAAFCRYKQTGIGRETHKMMLNHYRQVKNLHVSYSEKKLGFF